MVKILMLVPHMDMQDQFAKIVKRCGDFPDIKIELTYVFGTPESLSRNRDAEIFVARGMTFDRLRVLFPKKHIIEIQMTSFNILDALILAKNEHHPSRIALCVHNMELQSLSHIEELCQAKIDVYDVWDEEDRKSVV